ncbi:Gfo/Idh/MocA family protein [Demequina capsici]|uniref:Gfo/Idh/MocA family oxidoreductase n=1 Tax=Demequina capsici TaxID=3075620 RepID=A0AA96J9K0_9MICO|nr:Gfo/Idh/MocA family oxidoreductase [Demequina sp. OYTSA14]WNM23581.1 Gfo/Idh/MocA family oxidoreductase [Demequina sp. OYTSA14]
MKKLRIGIVGLGYIGTAKHLAGLSAHRDRAEVVAFCDLELDKAEAAKEKYGNADAYVSTDYHQLLADDSIDVIHVCTWNVTHREITVAALEAGKHVMCEKPMAVTGEDARAMRDAAVKAGKKLSVGFQYRFRDDAEFMRKCADEGRFGEIYAARAHAVRRRGVPTWGVFTDKEKQGGGPLIDLGGHSIDLALWLMGNYDVESVTGVVNYKLGDKPEGNMVAPWDPETYDVEDSAFGFVRFKNGASLFVEAAWALNIRESREGAVTLFGTEGGCDSTQDGDRYLVTLNNVQGGELTTTTPGMPASYYGPGKKATSVVEYMAAKEANVWLDAILNDGDPMVTADQACVVTEILDAIYTSATTGKPVYFD